MEGAPGSDPSCWGEKAGRPASHITKCLILSSQHKRQGLAFIFHQTCWIGSKMGLWMQPSQAHAPHPWFLNPGKKATKERAQRRVGQSGKNPGTSPNSPVTSSLTAIRSSDPGHLLQGQIHVPHLPSTPTLPRTQCLLRRAGGAPSPAPCVFLHLSWMADYLTAGP